MAIRIWESTLVLGLASAMALAAAAPSFGQTQQQRQRAMPQEQGLRAAPADGTTGQAAPRTQSRAQRAQQGAAEQQAAQQQCWIPTNNDLGFGYYGSCSTKGSRPIK